MTAAHGGYGSERVPLGGGAAICERLCDFWKDDPELEIHLCAPGPNPPPGVVYHHQPLLDVPPSSLDEFRYARFCRSFEASVTNCILGLGEVDAVLAHDISEGPDFQKLAQAGIACLPIFHVDVVDFFNRIYLKELLPVEKVVAFFRALPAYPDLLKLVFEKQEQAVRTSPCLIVPCPAMKQVLQKCYPGLDPTKIEAVGWGAPEAVPAEAPALEKRGPLLITLSRISPEKGQDRLLQALEWGHRRGEIPPGLEVAICGGPAFMQGEQFYRQLKRMAARCPVPVHFPGHLGGQRKHSYLQSADLFVVGSRHESYGLTTLEALQHGCPVVAVESWGTQATIEPEFGRLVPPGNELPLRLWCAIRDLLEADRSKLRQAAQAYARRHTFGKAAGHLKQLVLNNR